LDLGCVFDEYNYSLTEDEADAKAAYSDWMMVGMDILAALGRHERWTYNPESK
jgi:hypothetical protein